MQHGDEGDSMTVNCIAMDGEAVQKRETKKREGRRERREEGEGSRGEKRRGEDRGEKGPSSISSPVSWVGQVLAGMST